MITQEWIKAQNFQFKKVNVRPYGVYELVVSIDGGNTWAAFNRPFGWGFTEIEAFEMVLTEIVNDVNLHQSIKQWMGEERFYEMIKPADAPGTALIKIEKEPYVPEHIHHE